MPLLTPEEWRVKTDTELKHQTELLEKLDHTVHGNGKPGLVADVRELERRELERSMRETEAKKERSVLKSQITAAAISAAATILIGWLAVAIVNFAHQPAAAQVNAMQQGK